MKYKTQLNTQHTHKIKKSPLHKSASGIFDNDNDQKRRMWERNPHRLEFEFMRFVG